MILIKNAHIINADNSFKGDILLKDNLIHEIASSIKEETSYTVYDIKGAYVLPGCIDPHTHLDMQAGKIHTIDNFSSGTKAGIVGGTTTIIDFATQEKGKSLRDAYQTWSALASNNCSCNYAFHMAITDWNTNIKNEIKTMKDIGITSFKMYMAYDELICNEEEILECLKEVKKINGILGIHCENGSLINALVKEARLEGRFSIDNHYQTRPDLIEAVAINTLACITKLANYKAMVVHLSSELGLKEVIKAREKGINLLVETCPQYLLLDECKYHLDGFESAKFVASPPLRKPKDNNALIKAIQNDQIDTIGTDHCSFSYDNQKIIGLNDFSKIPNGMPGIQDRLSLIYTNLVQTNKISINKMVQLLSSNVARIYGMYPSKGLVAIGCDADLVVYDPNFESVICIENGYSKVDYNPYEGYKKIGKIAYVFLNGELVVKDEQLIKPNIGKYIK